MRTLSCLIVASSIAGCADPSPSPTQVAANAASAPAQAASTVTYCHKEKPIGSTLPQNVCHTESSDGSTQDAATEATVRDMQRQGTLQVQRSLNPGH